MKKLIAAAIASTAALLTALLVAPSAFAMVPPEPAGPSSAVPAAEQTSAAFVSWPTVAVAVIAVAVGAVVALLVERRIQRHPSSGLAAA
jgi:hypothetical protein